MSTITSSYVTPVPAPTAWRAPGKEPVGAWRCLIVRSGGFIARTEALLALLILTIGYAAYAFGLTGSASATLGAAALLVACRAAFYAGGGAQVLRSAPLPFAVTLVRSAALALLACGLVFMMRPHWAPDALVAAVILLGSSVSFLALRWLTQSLVESRRLVEECLIVGGADKAERFFRELTSAHAGCVLPVTNSAGEVACVVDFSRIQELATRGALARIVVADPSDRHPELSSLLVDCKLRGLSIEAAVDSYEQLSGKIWVEGLRPDWLIYSSGFRREPSHLFAKRAFDIAAALLLLVTLAPLMLLVAAAIKLESAGPAVFAQERVGHHGRTFVLYKFRSMGHEAEKDSGPVWAGEKDARITPLGRILRKCRLDELPQIVNVLKGEMSFVGPRPERPYFVDLLKQQIPFYELRHYVRPGVTGWAQVEYPYGASVEDSYQKLQYDLYYSKHMSLRFDLLILLKTVRVVLLGRGAR